MVQEKKPSQDGFLSKVPLARGAAKVSRAGREILEGWNVTILLGALWASLCWALFLNKAELWLVLAGFVGFSLLCLVLDVVLPDFQVPADKAIFISAAASTAHVTTMLAGSGKHNLLILLLYCLIGI